MKDQIPKKAPSDQRQDTKDPNTYAPATPPIEPTHEQKSNEGTGLPNEIYEETLPPEHRLN